MAENQTGPALVGKLSDTSPYAFRAPMGVMQLPGQIVLKSVDAGRKIEISLDGGVEYFQPAYDKSTATMLSVVVNAPITNIRLTGAAADTYLVF